MKKIILTTWAVILFMTIAQAQTNKVDKDGHSKKSKLHVEIKESANPDVYVDGKKFDFPIELLDKDQIESVKVIKDEEALKKYNAKYGVILITTKKNPSGFKETCLLYTSPSPRDS